MYEEKLAIASQLPNKIDRLSNLESVEAGFRYSRECNGLVAQICKEELVLARQLPNNRTLLVAKLNNLGDAQSQLEDYAAAIERFKEALELDPNNGTSLSGRAVAHIHLKDYRLAIDDLNTEIKSEIDPVSLVYARLNRAAAYQGNREGNKATDDLRACLLYVKIHRPSGSVPSANANIDAIYIRAARLFETMGSFKEAVQQYDEILSNSKRAAYYIKRGDLYQRMHRPELAASDYSAALAFTKEMSLPESESITGQLLSYQPIGASVYAKRAQAYTALRKPDLAATDRLCAAQLLATSPSY